MTLLSVIVPAWNERQNLPQLYERLHAAMARTEVDWELIIVDDHSTDGSFEFVSGLAERDPRVRGFRHSRNYGSYVAIVCGLEQARGACAVVMAADLQDPPELIPELLARWHEGAQVVWAARRERLGESAATIGSSRLFYFLLRHLAGVRGMPPRGADFLLMDRVVLDACLRFGETNISIMALIAWMGFRQQTVEYDKQARVHGSSGWSFGRKVKLAIDSITSFSYFPIRAMSYVGAGVAAAGCLYACVVIVNALFGHPPQGWSSLMVVILVMGGIQMAMMGVLGEYLWRALDESRKRPRYLLEATTAALAGPRDRELTRTAGMR